MGAANCPKTARFPRSGEGLELMSWQRFRHGDGGRRGLRMEDPCRHRMFLPNESNADLMLMAMSFYSTTQNEENRRVILNHLCLRRGASVVPPGWSSFPNPDQRWWTRSGRLGTDIGSTDFFYGILPCPSHSPPSPISHEASKSHPLTPGIITGGCNYPRRSADCRIGRCNPCRQFQPGPGSVGEDRGASHDSGSGG